MGAAAKQHVVGGSSGWDESTDFNSWSDAQTFRVGDHLEFKYSSGLHSVVELGGETAFKNCDVAGTNTLKSYSTGSDSIKLTKTGTRYFACGTSGHCDQGMKVKITTVAAADTTTTTTTPSSSQGSTDTVTGSAASSNNASSSGFTSSSPHKFHFILSFFTTFIIIASFLV